jgi:hypothetical protein
MWYKLQAKARFFISAVFEADSRERWFSVHKAWLISARHRQLEEQD